MPTTTPTQLSYDGFGINGDDEYKSRLLTWASSTRLTMSEAARTQLGNELIHRYHTHATIVAALEAVMYTLKAQDENYDLRDSYQQGKKALAQERSAP